MKLWSVPLLASFASAKVYFSETFDENWEDRWVHSSWKEKDGTAGRLTLDTGKWYVDEEADKGLFTPDDARFYTVATSFPEFSNEGKTLIIQFQLKYEKDLECGGGYVKIGGVMDDLTKFSGDSEYNIMFGPDKCGYQKRTHLIFQHKGKNVLKKVDLEYKQDDIGVTSLYTLIVKPDNTVVVKVDQKELYSGRMEDDWELLAPKKIDDPSAKKPDDWVDEAMMDDPEDKKPEDSEEEKTIADPEAKQPEDWNEEEDGLWEPPMIANPAYDGPWTAKRIANPDYKGPWTAPQIDNPDYVADDALYKYDFGFLGIDLWQVKSGSLFDNFIMTDDEEEANKFAEKWETLVEYEKEKKKAETAKAKDTETAKAKDDDSLDVAPDGDADLDDDEDL